MVENDCKPKYKVDPCSLCAFSSKYDTTTQGLLGKCFYFLISRGHFHPVGPYSAYNFLALARHVCTMTTSNFIRSWEIVLVSRHPPPLGHSGVHSH